MNAPTNRLSQPEFIGLIAAHIAMVAYSIDAMLPALPEIASTLSPNAPNKAQLVLTSFIFGMGLGTFIVGPLSDRFGRKPVIIVAVVLFMVGAVLAGQAQSLETLLGARVLQGLGVAGPRIVALAIVRDQYEGRKMASIMSYVMLVFTLVPAIAPLVGSFIIAGLGWRWVFYSFVIFALLVVSWLVIRQPETLPPEARRSIHTKTMVAAIKECFALRVFTLSTLVQALAYGMLFGFLSSTHQIYDVTYGRAEEFPLWFAFVAVVAGSASILNARLVVRLGMQRMVTIGFGMQIAISAVVVAFSFYDTLSFGLFVFWNMSLFFMAGLCIGNLNALAMEPVGHIAGLASSVIGAASTICGVVLAAPIGLAFNGTAMPLAIATMVLSTAAFITVRGGLR